MLSQCKSSKEPFGLVVIVDVNRADLLSEEESLSADISAFYSVNLKDYFFHGFSNFNPAIHLKLRCK